MCEFLEGDLWLKFIFRTTDPVSCISGSKSPHPENRNKGIKPNIRQSKLRLNPIFMVLVFIPIKTNSFKNTTILLKINVICPVRIFLIVEHKI